MFMLWRCTCRILDVIPRRRLFGGQGDVTTIHRGCHALVRREESRCDIEVLCPVGDSEGAQLERDEQDAEADGRQEGEEAQVPMRRKPAGTPTKEEVRGSSCVTSSVSWTGVLNVSLEGPRTGRIEPGTVRETLTVPEVHLDYCFIREVAGEDYSVVLVGKDRETKLILAQVVPFKGDDTEWVSEQVCHDLRKFGISGDVV